MPEIKNFPRTRVAYLTSVGPFGQSIRAGMERLMGWVGANQVQPMGAPLGMFPDDPSKVPPEQLRSEIAIPVGPDVMGSGEVQIREIGGFEAATNVYHNPHEIESVYNDLYAWLQQQGYRDSGDPLEVYLGQGEQFMAEVFVPVVKVEAIVKMEAPSAPAPAAKKAAAKKAASKKAVTKKRASTKKTARKKTASKKASRKKSTAKRGRRK